MAESSDGRGVILFGGLVGWSSSKREKNIMELRAGSNSWNILNIALEEGRREHVVIQLQ